MTNANDKAFSSGITDNPGLQGLTKREYFAAMAMQGVLADGSSIPAAGAERAVRYADALINELNKNP